MPHTFEIAHPVPRRGRMARTRRVVEDWGSGVTHAEPGVLSEAPVEIGRVLGKTLFAADGRAWIRASTDKSGSPASFEDVAEVLREPRYALTSRSHGLHGYLHGSPISLPTGIAWQRGNDKPMPRSYEPLWRDDRRAEDKVKAFVADRIRMRGDEIYLRYERMPFVSSLSEGPSKFLFHPRNDESLGIPLWAGATCPLAPGDVNYIEYSTQVRGLADPGEDLLWLANVLTRKAGNLVRGLLRPGPERERCMVPGTAEAAEALMGKLGPIRSDGLLFYNTEPAEILAALTALRDASRICADYYRLLNPSSRKPRDEWLTVETYLTEHAIPRASVAPADAVDHQALAGFAP